MNKGYCLRFGITLCIVVLSNNSFAAESDRYGAGVKIVGGSQATLSQWPWIGTLRYHNGATGLSGHVCGGTMIAPSWMLTAAHCLAQLKDENSLTGCYSDDREKTQCGTLEVILGHDDLSRPVAQSRYHVAELIVHEAFMTAYRAARARGRSPTAAVDEATITGGTTSRLFGSSDLGRALCPGFR